MGPGFMPTSIAVQDNDGTPHCEGRDDSVLVHAAAVHEVLIRALLPYFLSGDRPLPRLATGWYIGRPIRWSADGSSKISQSRSPVS
jgi:hypothetical protein